MQQPYLLQSEPSGTGHSQAEPEETSQQKPSAYLGEVIWDDRIYCPDVFPRDPAPERLTKAQYREALDLFEHEYTRHFMSYRQMPRNRPLWYLVELGLAEFASGPRGSWLKSQGFMPLWSDPIM